ncbi:nuclease S1 [Apiospora rasikravindrae]|uniref:Nuclease S1 n=1 Tax=Apiospora rasikravindrae TaxID=990691 RepID=A0ABR1RNQ6_9PEZI
MRLSAAAVGLLVAPTAYGWGSLGHITIAYVATNFVQDETAAYFKELLRNDTIHYMAGVATWADTAFHTRSRAQARESCGKVSLSPSSGQFTKNFHFIDAKDAPPTNCHVDFGRDCKKDGCVVSSLDNYTRQLLDSELAAWRRNQAAKFVIHFAGDISQPLHAENVEQGGNGIRVRWEGAELNLHHVWDSSIAEKMLGGIHRKPYPAAHAWAADLTAAIRDGKYSEESKTWTDGMSLDDPIQTSMAWARESNAHVCDAVLPDGPSAIVGQELASGMYFARAAPVVELQVARAGYRLARWLDLIVERVHARGPAENEL